MVLNKSKLFEFYITHRNYFNKGVEQVYTIKTVVSSFLLIAVFIKSYDIRIPIGILLGLGLITAILFWAIGLVWDRWKLFHKETEWSNKRNPMMTRIERKL